MRFYYSGGCRQEYMKTSPAELYYLHPNPGAKPSVYAKDKTSYMIEQNSMREFALAIWEHWFSRLPIFNKVIKQDKRGIYYDHALGVPATHFLLGMIRRHSSIMSEIQKSVKDWRMEELVRAMRIGQAQSTSISKRAHQNKSTLARFCVILSDIVRPSSGKNESRKYPVTTDAIVPINGAKLVIPPELQPQLDFNDFEYLRRHNVKTSNIIIGEPIWEELVDNRYRFLQVKKTTFAIRNGKFVLPEEVEAIDKIRVIEDKKRMAAEKKANKEKIRKIKLAAVKKAEIEKKEAEKKAAKEVEAKISKSIIVPTVAKKKPITKKPTVEKTSAEKVTKTKAPVKKVK